MRLWLTKNSSVPVREQLTTQIALGIVSGDLKPGARLPSTRELARRFKVHANTISAAYRELTERGWIELRSGSGVYVRPLDAAALPALNEQLELDRVIADFLRLARTHGYTLGEVRSRIESWLDLQPPDHFLVIEPDPDLRRILTHEIHTATRFPTRGAHPDELRNAATASLVLTGAATVAMYAHAERTRTLLPAGTTLLLLHTRSVPDSLRNEPRPSADSLITVVSGWADFLRYARHILLAAGLDLDALDFRDTRQIGWQRGLRSSFFVVTDSLTANTLPTNIRARAFHVISDSSIKELHRYVSDFLT